MSSDDTWMGRSIDGMNREELAAALKAAVRLLQAVTPSSVLKPDMEVRETAAGTVIGKTFRWAFIPAGYIWSEEDRQAVQTRLDASASRHGLHGAVVRFGADRLEVEVPRRLQIEQLLALQEWLDAEKETLDVSQVP